MTTISRNTPNRGDSPLDLILDALERAGSRISITANGYKAQCPSHPDKNPSLSVSEATAGGDALVNCFAKCSPEQVMSDLGLKMADLFAEKARPAKMASVSPLPKKRVATYEYKNEAGELLYKKHRYEPKTFSFEPKLGDLQRVLYRLPEVIEAAGSGVTIYYVEGEADVERLEAEGHIATTAGGAGNWRPEFAQYFAGAQLVEVVADNDPTGWKHAKEVLEALRPVVSQVRVWYYENGQSGADISDLLDENKSLDDLVRINESDWENLPKADEELALGIIEEAKQTRRDYWRSVTITPTELLRRPQLDPLVGGVFDLNTLAMIYGKSGSGKSYLALDIALSIASGREWAGREVVQAPVMLVLAEAENTWSPRVSAWAKYYGLEENIAGVHFVVAPPVLDRGDDAEHLAAIAEELGAKFVLFDTARASLEGDENDSREWNLAAQGLNLIREATGACVVLNAHSGWNEARERGSSARRGSMSTIIRVRKGANNVSIASDMGEAGKQRSLNATLNQSFRFTEVPNTENIRGELQPILVAGGDYEAASSQRVEVREQDAEMMTALEEVDPLRLGVTRQTVYERYRTSTGKETSDGTLRYSIDRLKDAGRIVSDGSRKNIKLAEPFYDEE